MASKSYMQPSGLWKLLIALLCSIYAIPFTQAHPLLTLNTTYLSAEKNPQCTPSTSWMKNGHFNPNDCLPALHKLEDTDLKIFKTRNIEFLAPGAVPRTKLDAVRLPRIYSFESCSIVISMLSTITEDFLPGQERQVTEYGSTDVSKFSYLWSVAAWVDGTCVVKTAGLGWCATGLHGDVGVFLVGTTSPVYNIILRGRTVGGNGRGGGRDIVLPSLRGTKYNL
ncbi:MAG: hypothetical protein Q9168_002018 [Polycauliona sp. 1 TL-2023]